MPHPLLGEAPRLAKRRDPAGGFFADWADACLPPGTSQVIEIGRACTDLVCAPREVGVQAEEEAERVVPETRRTQNFRLFSSGIGGLRKGGDEFQQALGERTSDEKKKDFDLFHHPLFELHDKRGLGGGGRGAVSVRPQFSRKENTT